jgi:hypothetical protein
MAFAISLSSISIVIRMVRNQLCHRDDNTPPTPASCPPCLRAACRPLTARHAHHQRPFAPHCRTPSA